MATPESDKLRGFLWLIDGSNDPYPRKIPISNSRTFIVFTEGMSLVLVGNVPPQSDLSGDDIHEDDPPLIVLRVPPFESRHRVRRWMRRLWK